MRGLRHGTTLLVLLGSLAPADAAAGQSPLAGTARLGGQFQLSGQVVVSGHIRGERSGQKVSRTWQFTPLCAAGPCQDVALVRHRTAGVDRLVLHLTAANHYAGKGRFFARLRCGRRIVRRGESVPFKIDVEITASTIASGVAVATQIQAAYVNPKRTNLTRCLATPGHDAAIYGGNLVGPPGS